MTRNHTAGQLSLLPSIELAPGPIEGTWTVHCHTCTNYRIAQRKGPKRNRLHSRAEYQATWRRAKRHA